MSKTVLIVVVMLLIVGGLILYAKHKSPNEEITPTKQYDVYAGAVPQGYDLEHYQKTGATIKQNG